MQLDKATADAAEFKAGFDKLTADGVEHQAQLDKATADAAEFKAGFDKVTADAVEQKAQVGPGRTYCRGAVACAGRSEQL